MRGGARRRLGRSGAWTAASLPYVPMGVTPTSVKGDACAQKFKWPAASPTLPRKLSPPPSGLGLGLGALGEGLGAFASNGTVVDERSGPVVGCSLGAPRSAAPCAVDVPHVAALVPFFKATSAIKKVRSQFPPHARYKPS